MKTLAFAIALAGFVTISLEFGNDVNVVCKSYTLISKSCRLPCHVTRCGESIDANCSNAECTRVPWDLRKSTTSLRLVKNNITAIYRNSFIALKKLVFLDISSGHLKIIENGSFDCLGRLEYLNLSFNPILRRFPENIFSRLSRLRELSLAMTISDCQFDTSLFSNFMQLEVLYFGLNELRQFPKFQRSGDKNPLLPRLKLLSLKGNNIRQIAAQDLHGLEDSLETLNLIGNKIYRISTHCFINMTRLKRLQLDSNPIGVIECNAFKSNTLEYLSIQHVELRPNRGMKCTTDIFKEVPNLKILILARSVNLRLAASPLSSQMKLTALNLVGSNVDELFLRNVTSMLPQLRRLNIRENRIFSISSDLWHKEELHDLDIGRNLITTINATSFPLKIWNSLKQVDFSHNPFYCDCNLVWFRKWIRVNKEIVRKLDRILCSGPTERKGQRVIATDKPTSFECFRAEYDSCLTAMFLFCLIIFVSTSLASVLHRFRWYLQYWYFKTKSRARRLEELLDGTEYQFDAFISYSESDSRWVIGSLCQKLENEFNLRLCIHHRNWMIGNDIVTNIIDSIERSRKTVLIVSNSFAGSQWCHFELTMAQTKLFEDDRDNLILVLLEEVADCNMNPRLQLQMRKKTYVEWTDNAVGQQLFWDKLRQALTSASTSIINSVPPRELFTSTDET